MDRDLLVVSQLTGTWFTANGDRRDFSGNIAMTKHGLTHIPRPALEAMRKAIDEELEYRERIRAVMREGATDNE